MLSLFFALFTSGEVNTVHVCGSFVFVSYTAVLEAVSSVPVGMVRAFDLTRAAPPTDLKARCTALPWACALACALCFSSCMFVTGW